MARKLMVREVRRFVSHHRWTFAGGDAAGLLAIARLIGWLLWRRKRRLDIGGAVHSRHPVAARTVNPKPLHNWPLRASDAL